MRVTGSPALSMSGTLSVFHVRSPSLSPCSGHRCHQNPLPLSAASDTPSCRWAALHPRFPHSAVRWTAVTFGVLLLSRKAEWRPAFALGGMLGASPSSTGRGTVSGFGSHALSRLQVQPLSCRHLKPEHPLPRRRPRSGTSPRYGLFPSPTEANKPASACLDPICRPTSALPKACRAEQRTSQRRRREPVGFGGRGPRPGVALHQVGDELRDLGGALLLARWVHLPSDRHQAGRDLPASHCTDTIQAVRRGLGFRQLWSKSAGQGTLVQGRAVGQTLRCCPDCATLAFSMTPSLLGS